MLSEFLDYAMELGVEAATIAPGFSYEKAPQQDVFIKSQDTKILFRGIFELGKKLKAQMAVKSFSAVFRLPGRQSGL
jgi:hypothetical protein